jgi:hypothetical protein
MVSSPCRNCAKRHMPKDMCMKNCERLAAVQQLQHTMHMAPYTRNNTSDTFDCRHDLPLVLAQGEVG